MQLLPHIPMRLVAVLLFILTFNSLLAQTTKWVEPSSIDTTLIIENLTVKLSPSSAGDFDPYFLPNDLIKSLTKDFGNWYQKSLAIENYQMGRFGTRVKREGRELYVLLDNGSWFQLVANPRYDETGHNFEYYFEDLGFYSIRVQWGEGNGYKLVNSKNGEITHIIGRPFFSPNGKLIIALGNDIEAGYSINGFQLLTNNSGSITERGRYSPATWGCVNAKWLTNNKLTLKNESFEYSETSSNYFNFFTELEIN